MGPDIVQKKIVVSVATKRFTFNLSQKTINKAYTVINDVLVEIPGRLQSVRVHGNMISNTLVTYEHLAIGDSEKQVSYRAASTIELWMLLECVLSNEEPRVALDKHLDRLW